VPDVPDLPAGGGEQRELLVRLQAVIEAKDTEIGVLRSGLDAERELRRRLELRVAELERRLDQDSADSGTPTSKESIGARERHKARRRQRQESERDRRKDRKPGGQPGHPGMGLSRDPDPDETKPAEPPAAPEEAGEHDPDKHKDTASAGTPHVLIIRTPDGLLTWLQALGSRRKADVGAGIPAAFSGLLMTDGYTGYQHLLSRLAGIQQCCQPPGTKTGRPHRIMAGNQAAQDRSGPPASQDNVLLAQQERFRAGSSGAAAWPGRRSGSARRYGRPRW
jgi:hypothetical protein